MKILKISEVTKTGKVPFLIKVAFGKKIDTEKIIGIAAFRTQGPWS